MQVSVAVLAVVVCFAAAAEEAKSSPSVQSTADRSKRGLVAAPLVASQYVAAAPYVAASPYVAAAPYAAAPYVAAPYAAAPYAAAISSPYAAPYVSSYTSYPYVAKTLASPYTYYPWDTELWDSHKRPAPVQWPLDEVIGNKKKKRRLTIVLKRIKKWITNRWLVNKNWIFNKTFFFLTSNCELCIL